MNVKDLMTPSPSVCTPMDGVRHAARLMVSHDCGALPVVESELNRKAKGIITDRDIAVRVVAPGLDATATKVGEVMTSAALTVTPETTDKEAAALMESHKVRRLLVMEGDACVGIVSLADVARAASAQESGRVLKQVSEQTEEPALL